MEHVPAEMAPKIVPKLLSLLKSERQNTKPWAAQILGSYGSVSHAAVPDLLPMLENMQYERNRAMAATALGQILEDAEPSEEVEKVTQALIKRFTDGYPDVRREAVRACGMIGPAAKSCVPHLSNRLIDSQAKRSPTEIGPIRANAAWTVGRMGKHANAHIDRLIAMLHKERYYEAAVAVIDAIAILGPVHETVVSNVVDQTEKAVANKVWGPAGPSWEQRKTYTRHVFDALKKWKAKSAQATDLMVNLISREGWDQRGAKEIAIQALEVLGAVGPAAKKAVPTIEKNCKNHGDAKIKEAAQAALAKINAE
jgi:HEAT repeat protein